MTSAVKAGARAIPAQLFGLLLASAILYALSRTGEAHAGPGLLIAALGFLLLAGLLGAQLLELLRLPHLTAFILAGALAGPHVLHFVGHDVVQQLEPINRLALALLALAGGLELRASDVAKLARPLAAMQLTQTGLVFIGSTALFYLLRGQIPFTEVLTFQGLIAVAILWGLLAVSRSPAATLGILAETRAQGPLASFSLAFVMSSDVIVVVLMAIALAVCKPLLDPTATLSLHSLDLVRHEIVGSISLGATLGLVLIAYLRVIGSEIVLVLLALGFAATEGLKYLHFDPMLTFLCAGFVVQNLSSQGEKLLHAIENLTSVVFVVFFATAGAHLDLPLLATLWKVALSLCAGRALFTLLGHAVALPFLRQEAVVRRWASASLISQAGLTLGMSALVSQTFPSFGAGFRALAVATVAVNEVIGPILFKLGLERAGESQAHKD